MTQQEIQNALWNHVKYHHLVPCRILDGLPGQQDKDYGVVCHLDERTGMAEVLVKGGATHHYRPEGLRLLNADIRTREERTIKELPDGAIRATMDNLPRKDSLGLVYYLQLAPYRPYIIETLNPFSTEIKALIEAGKVWIDSPPKKRTYV